MKFWKSKEFLNLYFIIQCVVAVISLIALTYIAIICMSFSILGYMTSKTITDIIIIIFNAGIFVCLAQIYFSITLISTISTFKVKQGKILTRFEKLSSLIFPVITGILLLMWYVQGSF